MKIFKKLLGTFLVVLMVFTSIPLQGFMGLNFKDMISFKAEAASSASTSAVEFNGHYYKVYEIDKLWNDAKTYCESVGGYLATVTSKEENEFLMSIIGDYYCFLGGTDIESENVWKWVTGETWSYTNWMTGEPNNGDNVNEGQDFLTIYGSNGDAGTYGKWDDGWNEKHYFVCEWDFSPDLNDNPTSGFLSSGDFAIGTSDDLVELARLVNKEKQDFAGKKIVLLNSIDLTGIELEPIGSSSSTPFKGSFDGNGYTISGIKITTSRDQNGLFGYVYSDDSVFSNVTLSGSISNGLYSGGLIGNLKVPKKGNFKVQNIINKCSVRCQDTWNDNITAGVIGCINSYGNANIEIIGCINSGSITSAAGLADSYTGGIVSCIYAAKTDYYKFYRCLHNGSLSSSAPKGYYDGYAGGIVAYMSNGNYIVDECMASGRVYCLGYDTHSGGLIGKMTPHSFEIKNCVLTSNVTGKCSSGDAEASCTVGGCYEDNYDDNSVWEFENILVSGQITDTYGQAALVINDERDGASLKKISVNNCFFNTSKLNIPTDRFLAWTALLSGTNTITTKVANSQGYSYNTLKTNKRLYSAWNFSEVWEFGEDGLPRLRCFGSMKNVLQSDGTIRLQALAYNKNKELVQVGNANLTLWLGDTQIGKTLTPDGDGYFSINVDELYKENPKILLDNVKVHVEALIEDNIRGVNGNGLYLLSDYDFGEESLNYYLNNSGDIILDNKQLRIDMLSIAYTTRLANNVDVKTVCSDFMSKLYKMTGGRINIKQMKTTEYLTHVGVNNSNANILAYYDYEKSCANLDGYWSGGHIWMSQTYSDGFTSGVLCHEALHYILGVRDEYCCGYRIEGNSYDFDFDCDGEIYEDDYDIYYVADNIETEGGEKITNKYINLLIDSSKETIEIQPSFKKLDLTIDDLKNGNIFQYKNSYDLSDYFCDNSVYISTILEKNGTNFGFIFSYPLSNGDSFGIMESNYDGELFMSDASTYRYIDQSMKDNKREYAHKFTAQYYDTEYDNEFLSVTQKLDKVLEGVLTSNNYSNTRDNSKAYLSSTYDFNIENSTDETNPYDEHIKDYTFTNVALCDVSFVNNESLLVVNVEGESSVDAIVYLEDGTKIEYPISSENGKASFVVNASVTDIEKIIIRNIGDAENKVYNEYYFEDLSEELSGGDYISKLMTTSVESSSNDGIVIIADNKQYVNGDYFAVCTPFTVLETGAQSDVSATFNQTVSYSSDIDISSIKAFKIEGGEFKEIECYRSTGELNTIYFDFEYAGEGKYVVMAKPAAETEYLTPSDLSVSTVKSDYSKTLEVSFDDTNEEGVIEAYNLYWSDEVITDTAAENVKVRTLMPGKDVYTLYMTEDYGKLYFAIEAIGVDGGKSPLSESIEFNMQPIDSDGDGIPDEWLKKYSLPIDFKNIGLIDSDNDGLNNLSEYNNGTNPINPDTDGDNVDDAYEIQVGLNPNNIMSDGAIHDYVVCYGNPDIKFLDESFEVRDDIVYCEMKNIGSGVAKNASISLYVDDVLYCNWLGNFDAGSVLPIEFPVEYLGEVKNSLKIVVDEEKRTFDADYSNNSFEYKHPTEISFAQESYIVIKDETITLVPDVVSENTAEILRWSYDETENITVDNHGVVSNNGIGKITVTASTFNGLSAVCEVEVVAFEGAEYTEFDSQLINSGKEVEITGYIGDDVDITIPDTIGGLPVTSIKSIGVSSVENVTIPASVKSVTSTAFNNSNKLKSITVDDKNFNYSSENGILYSKDKTQLIRCPIAIENKEIAVPNGVLEIAGYAFNSVGLTAVTFPTSLNIIRSESFSNNSFTSITIPENVTRIEKNSFYGCVNLTEVNYNAKLAETGVTGNFLFAINAYSVFKACTSISIVNVGSEVTNIPTALFTYLTGLTTVNISADSKLTTIANYAFYGSSNINDINYGRYYKYWKLVSVGSSGNSPFTSANVHCLECDEHSWRVSSYTTVPNCVATGTALYVCEVCEKEQSGIAEIDKNNHISETLINKKATTCDENGYTGDLYCSSCETIIEKGEVIAASGHSLVNVDAQEATCTAIGWYAYTYCEICDYSTYEEIAALNHDIIVDEVVAPTCTETGLTEGSHCSRCNNATVEQEVIPATNHKDTIIQVAAQAKTCSAFGWDAYEYCTECDYSTYKEIPASHEIVKAAAKVKTCSTVGWDAYEHCTECDYTTYKEIPASHEIKTVSKKAATCKKVGHEAYEYCTECTYTTYREIPVVNHIDLNGDYKCDYGCGHEFENPPEPSDPIGGDCSHLCHKSGFMGFIWGIVRFFWKLFKMNPTCECGVKHY